MSDKFSLYQTDGLWGIIENASDKKQTSIKSYFGSDLIVKLLNEQADQIDQLKQQLDEKQKTIDEINKEFVQAVHDWKALCAKKDNEIETMKKDSDKNIDYLVEFASLIENEKDCNRMLKALDRVKSGNKYIIDKANQSKTEFAIQELEKVKILLQNAVNYEGYTFIGIYDAVNNQIKELKGK